MDRSAIRLLFVLAVVIGSSRVASAQAWVGYEHNLEATVTYDFTHSTNIIENPGDKLGPEPITSHAIIPSLEFVPIEKLAVSAALPLIAIKYSGSGKVFPPHGSYDDGDFHYTLQDFALGARYQILAEPLALAALASVSVPVADYETVGYANAGRHLKQAHFGAAVGKFIDSFYVHAQYEFTLSEKYDKTANTQKVGQNRSDIAVTAGYLFLDGKLELNAGANARIPHGGIDFVDFMKLPVDIQMNHDPLLREEVILIGPGIAYRLTDTLRITAIGRLWVYGKNTRDANSIDIGLNWDIM